MKSEGLEDNSFGEGDDRLIDLDDPSERAYWCKFFGVGEKELVATVRAVGNGAQSVKDALRSRRPGQADEGRP